jgi:alpha-L-fucosidase
VGNWMRRNGEAVYGSHAWKVPGEGELVNGKLKMLPGGALNRKQAEFSFSAQDFRFTTGKDKAQYSFCMTVPAGGTRLMIKSLGSDSSYLDKPVKQVTLLGHKGKLIWKQEKEGLMITCPAKMPFSTAIVFKIE